MSRRIVNRYAGLCRLYHQDVPASTGIAVKDDEPHAPWQVEHAEDCPPNPHNPDDTPTWDIDGGEGYGREPFISGASRREQWWTGRGGPGPDAVPGGLFLDEDRDEDRRVFGVVTMVTAHARYYSEEGMSFGVGDEEGYYYYYSARVRAATEQEAAPVLEAEARHKARSDLETRRKSLLRWMVGDVADARHPERGAPELESLHALPQVPLRPYDQPVL
ncbi:MULTISPECIES: hypothetical protein [Actinosynnema]|uniref:hypothetical protein n=1 Tax=Actinosynnema TaxID=40566 RepID=UPI0020A4F4D8|nr:hypothetical protein [Actinosynnema pretiosum]MCP2097349.1 hypothetical protein [Actinosynnema pretiosum]